MNILNKLKSLFGQTRKDRPYLERQPTEPKEDKIYLEEARKPELLKKLESFENSDNSMYSLGFWIGGYEGRYSSTPLDVIPFGWTDGNGIHFAFLTDFGRITDLNEAPIICVAPTYYTPIHLVAKNLRQFLTFIAHLEDAEILADIYESEHDLEEKKLDFINFMNETEQVAQRARMIEILKIDFDILPEPKVFELIWINKANRAQQVNTSSIEELGIILPNEQLVSELAHTKDIEKIQEFLETANLNSRIKFYREATYIYILSKGYDEEIAKLLGEYLEKDGFMKEAERLKLSW